MYVAPAYTNDVRRFVLIVAPVWGLIMFMHAIRAIMVTVTGQLGGQMSLTVRLMFIGVSAFYFLMTFGMWRVFNFYLKKKGSTHF
jgi:hypothetical protein